MIILSQILLVLFSAFSSVWANDEEMLKAYQREYAFLISQQEALNKQEAKLNIDFKTRMDSFKKSNASLAVELAKLGAENDDLIETITRLEKRKKELHKSENALQMAQRKATRLVNQHEAGIKFTKFDDKTTEAEPTIVRMSDVTHSMDRLLKVLQDSNSAQTQNGVFLNDQDQLVEGEIYRVGRFAALASTSDGAFVLAPNGEGFLKTIEKVAAAKIAPNSENLNSIYIFASLNEAAKVRKSAGLLEASADLLPALFLIAMMLVVSGLFILMARQ